MDQHCGECGDDHDENAEACPNKAPPDPPFNPVDAHNALAAVVAMYRGLLGDMQRTVRLQAQLERQHRETIHQVKIRADATGRELENRTRLLDIANKTLAAAQQQLADRDQAIRDLTAIQDKYAAKVKVVPPDEEARVKVKTFDFDANDAAPGKPSF